MTGVEVFSDTFCGVDDGVLFAVVVDCGCGVWFCDHDVGAEGGAEVCYCALYVERVSMSGRAREGGREGGER